MAPGKKQALTSRLVFVFTDRFGGLEGLRGTECARPSAAAPFPCSVEMGIESYRGHQEKGLCFRKVFFQCNSPPASAIAAQCDPASLGDVRFVRGGWAGDGAKIGHFKTE